MAGRLWVYIDMVRNKTKDIFGIEGKVVVITGAAGLLGEKHAEAIASFGGIPLLLDVRKKEVDQLAARIREEYGVVSHGYVVDITDEKQIERNVEDIMSSYPVIDGLINNAANNPKVEDGNNINFSRLENFPLQVWNQDMAVGLTGAYLCAKWYGTAISKNPNGGSIVNIASDLGIIAPDQRLYRKEGIADDQQPVKPVTYSVVKSGLIGLSRYLATYWPEKKVRSNAICSGGIFNNQDEKFLADIKERIPMGRMAQVEELQGALVYLLSDASSYVTGTIITVDGGRTVW